MSGNEPENNSGEKGIVSSKSNVFQLKDFPYIFTFIISLLSFNFNFLIKDFTESPIIEYSFDKIYNKADSSNTKRPFHQSYNFVIQNISKNIKFDSILVGIVYLEDESISRIPIIEDMKVFEKSIAPIYQPSLHNSNTAFINILNFQPNSSYVFHFDVRNSVEEYKFPSVQLSSKSVINLKKRNWETFIIRNQILLNLILSVFLIFVILGYTFYLSTKS